MDETELVQLELDVCALINQLERLRTENASLSDSLIKSQRRQEALQRNNTKMSLKIQQIIRRLQGEDHE